MKCEKCGKRTMILYYHTNRKNKKWMPILNYCRHCGEINGSVRGKERLGEYHDEKFKDYRYTGEIHHIKSKGKKLIDNISEETLKKLSEEDLKKLEETDTYDYCEGKMVKLYGLFRVEGKQKWIPVFWYCLSCEVVVKRVDR